MTENGYLVPEKEGRTEFVERKSRFITTVARVSTVEEADSFLSRIREEFPDATHNCAAYRLKNPLVERFFDDGEPGGTAGMPMLDVLKKEGLFDVAVVVTRYFGGILLGAGGLVRAYSRGASEGVRAVGVAKMEAGVELRVVCDYGIFDRLQRIWADFGAQALNTEFGTQITVDLLLKTNQKDGLNQKIMDVSAGAAQVFVVKEGFYPFSI